ncbi:MAG: hypothetical protein ACRDYU_13555 [Actinomycetes bacterium]
MLELPEDLRAKMAARVHAKFTFAPTVGRTFDAALADALLVLGEEGYAVVPTSLLDQDVTTVGLRQGQARLAAVAVVAAQLEADAAASDDEMYSTDRANLAASLRSALGEDASDTRARS